MRHTCVSDNCRYAIVHDLLGSERGVYAHNFQTEQDAQHYIDQRIARDAMPEIVKTSQGTY